VFYVLLEIYFSFTGFFSFFDFCQLYQVSTDFSKYLPSFLFLVDFIWILSSLMTFIECADFYRLLPSFTAVNRKFLYTDFRLLSTSVNVEIFTDFYRSQKKIKHPRCLIISDKYEN